MLTAIKNVLRIQFGGLFYLALPCNSFTWMCWSQHQRSVDLPFGNEADYEFVRSGNRIATQVPHPALPIFRGQRPHRCVATCWKTRGLEIFGCNITDGVGGSSFLISKKITMRNIQEHKHIIYIYILKKTKNQFSSKKLWFSSQGIFLQTDPRMFGSGIKGVSIPGSFYGWSRRRDAKVW